MLLRFLVEPLWRPGRLVVLGMALTVCTLPVHAHGEHTHGQAHAAEQGHGAHHLAGAHQAVHTFPDPATAPAQEGVQVSDCWIRALPKPLPAAGYFALVNSGTQDLELVGAQADGFGHVMLHTHQTSNGMARMVHLDAVPVPAGGKLEFAPGGHHVMLEQPARQLEVGTQHTIVLWFKGDKALTVTCDVRPAGTVKHHH